MFEIQLAKGAKPTGGTLVTAFPSVGMVGTIAGSFVAESLKMERIAYILSDEVPPAALVQDGVPSYPIRMLGHKDLSIILSEFQMPLALSSKLGKALLDWSEQNGYGLVICLEGLMMGEETDPTKEVRVFGVGSTVRVREMLTQAKIEQFKIGMITGVSGTLLSEGERLGKDVICLLVEANAMYPDARGAAKLVETATKLLPNLQIDMSELMKEAQMIEENVKATVERTKEMLTARQGQAERLGKSYMYG